MAGLVDLIVAVGARPAAGLQQALDSTLYVESPPGQVRLEAQGFDGDPDFNAPSSAVAPGRCFPDPVPVGVDLFAPLGHQSVEPRPVRIDREHIARAPVLKRVEHDEHVIVQLEIEVTRLGERDDARGMGIVTHHAEDEFARIDQDFHRGLTRRGAAFFRLDRHEVHDGVRGAPSRLIQPAIERELPREDGGAQDVSRRAGTRGFCCRVVCCWCWGVCGRGLCGVCGDVERRARGLRETGGRGRQGVSDPRVVDAEIGESSASLVSVPSVIVSVTVPVKLASVWPVESCAATCTAGLTVASAFVACGCTVNTSRDARCAPAAPAKISDRRTPAHHGMTLCGRMFKFALDGSSSCCFHGGP